MATNYKNLLLDVNGITPSELGNKVIDTYSQTFSEEYRYTGTELDKILKIDWINSDSISIPFNIDLDKETVFRLIGYSVNHDISFSIHPKTSDTYTIRFRNEPFSNSGSDTVMVSEKSVPQNLYSLLDKVVAVQETTYIKGGPYDLTTTKKACFTVQKLTANSVVDLAKVCHKYAISYSVNPYYRNRLEIVLERNAS